MYSLTRGDAAQRKVHAKRVHRRTYVGCIPSYLVILTPASTGTSVVSLFGVILIARPTAIFGSAAYPSTGLPVSPEGGVGGSRTNWGNIPTPGGGRGESTPAQRVQAVMFALMGVCGSSGACKPLGLSPEGYCADTMAQQTPRFEPLANVPNRFTPSPISHSTASLCRSWG
jgi:hypothetical protein